MFDVFRSRDKAVRAFLIFLLGLVALSMVTYLIPNQGTGAATGDDAVVAQIGSDKITATEINQTIRPNCWRFTRRRSFSRRSISVRWHGRPRRWA